MPDVASQLANDNRFIRKHGTQIFAIADYSAAVPEDWFGAPDATTGVILPIALPEGYFNMGYITTDGIKDANNVSASAVNMVQDLDPVRNDIDGMTKTLDVTFGESNAWTRALAHGIPVADWPASKTVGYEYHDGDKADFPFYRGLILTQDGVGSSRFYRVEFAYRMQVTDIADRTLNRTDVEATGRTFTCLRDPEVGRSYTEASTGLIVAPAQAGGGS
ncbi:hypothetical protein [Curtobacterium sp. MCBD17_028]|uniref:hypothetical protein n=1 Tax=Curtobacterium sp. MCBD17_028 TaxID=2175670 RepID=UPI0011B3C4A6|nr:hypothetical protein [Curtobacterium sp. MCBD17_028]